MKQPRGVTVDLEVQDGEGMCKKYKLKAKRPWQNHFTDWSATDDYEVIKRHIKVIESYGYEWKLTEREQEDEQRED